MPTRPFALGRARPLADAGEAQPFHLPAHHLVTHGVVVGMTGSGKTGLSMVLVEEALRSGVLEEQVECVEEQDFSRNEVSYRRIDNGKICGVRAMTGSERQTSIEGIDVDQAPVVSIDKGKAKKRLKAVADIENPVTTPDETAH